MLLSKKIKMLRRSFENNGNKKPFMPECNSQMKVQSAGIKLISISILFSKRGEILGIKQVHDDICIAFRRNNRKQVIITLEAVSGLIKKPFKCDARL